MKRHRREWALILSDLILAVMTLGSFLSMSLGRTDDGRLIASGFRSLRYFTVDSNIICGIAALCEASAAAVSIVGGRTPGRFVRILRLAGTSGVVMTFLVVMVFLGPVMGYRYMFVGASLYMHLLAPLLAAATFILFRLGRGIAKKEVVLGSVPLAVYAVWYIAGVIREGAAKRDWYHLAAWGPAWYPPVLALIILVSAGLSFALWRFGGGKAGQEPTTDQG